MYRKGRSQFSSRLHTSARPGADAGQRRRACAVGTYGLVAMVLMAGSVGGFCINLDPSQRDALIRRHPLTDSHAAAPWG